MVGPDFKNTSMLNREVKDLSTKVSQELCSIEKMNNTTHHFTEYNT